MSVSFVIRTPRSKRPTQDMIENTPAPSGRCLKRTRQDLNDAGYNPAVPGTSMANIYRDLAVRFVIVYFGKVDLTINK